MGTSGRPERDLTDITLLSEQTQSLTAAFAALEEAARKNASASDKEVNADNAATDATQKRTKAEKEAERKINETYGQVTSNLRALGRSFMEIADAGVKLAQSTGVSATKGMQLELANRAKVLSQIFTTDLNRISSGAELAASQQAVADTFVGFREGMQASADGAQAFNAQLKGGFKSDFQLTGASLRALSVIGATTEGQMDAFRRATGRASLSSSQLSNIVNKNTLSFLLYGNKFAKAATQAEMMGISLESIQNAQKGLVTNLDNTIDTVAQLNQLGAQVDFGTLVRIAEQEGPDALLRYIQSTVPQGLLQSTSFRSLFEQLGISSETLLKANKAEKTATSLQAKLSETAQESGLVSKAFTFISRSGMVLFGSFGGLILATVGATLAMIRFARAGGSFNTAVELLKKSLLGPGKAPIPPSPVNPLTAMGGLARLGTGLAALAVAVGGISYGIQQMKQGNTKTGIGLGAAGGAIGALLAGTAILGAIPTGGLSLALLGGGALAGGGITYAMGKGDDIASGYGSRTLLTSSGAYALNNRDTVIAGTNLFKSNDVMSFGAGALTLGNLAANPLAMLISALGKPAGAKSGELEKKIDALITTIQNANTVININDTKTQTNRMAVVSVQTTRGG
jgi:hypothetical protein